MFEARRKRLGAWLVGVALAASFGLGACGTAGDEATALDTQTTDSVEASTEGTELASDGEATGKVAEGEDSEAASIRYADGTPGGKPWVTSIYAGNLPDQAPALRDDIYTHFDFDWLSEHQGESYYTYLGTGAGELRDAVMSVLADESRDDHAVQQMRILYEQASDLEALEEIGFSEVQPYIDQIDAVSTIEEMNELLASRDFPFSPFVVAVITSCDTRESYGVEVHPNLMFADALLDGAAYYQDSEDETVRLANAQAIERGQYEALQDCELIGISPDEVADVAATLLAFEKPYAQRENYDGKYLSAPFGTYAQVLEESVMTLEEACAHCPHVPLAGMLDACGKGEARVYRVEAGWLEALDALWSDENLETIKLAAKVKVLNETRPYRDPSALDESARPDAETHGYAALDSSDTFSHALAETYVREVIGEGGQQRIRDLAAELLDTYSELIADTAWLSDTSEALVREKLDHMTLNILAPAGGYMDYDGLELKASEDGGTLLSNYLLLKRYRQVQEARLLKEPCAADNAWYLYSPTMANAFYDPGSNSISIFPGVVTSATYAASMTDTDLMAGIGQTIAHEISHAFDYTGSQTDAYGLANAVFTADDLEVFLAKSQSLADYYSSVEYAPGRFVDGVNVQGEATADLCGTQALLALGSRHEDFDVAAFFEGCARTWARVVDDRIFPLLVTDVHPLANLRVNVNAQMFGAIYDELGVSEGDGMYLAPEERINIWGEDA